MILSGQCAVAGGILLPLSLSYPKKECWRVQRKKSETYTNLFYEFIYLNSLVRLHICESTRMNLLYDLIREFV
jgi:hypothetical protein